MKNTILLLIFLIPLLHHSFSQSTVILSSVKDNTLYEESLGDVSNGAGEYMIAGRTSLLGSGAIRRALVQFDINTNIPAGVQIKDVEFQLKMTRTASPDSTYVVSMHRMQEDWGEGTSNALGNEGAGAAATTGDATWVMSFYDASDPFGGSTFWANSGGLTQGGVFEAIPSAAFAVTDTGFYTWESENLVSDVQNWLDNPGSNLGWILVGDESRQQTAKRFNTKENPQSNTRPILRVTYGVFPVEFMGFEAQPDFGGVRLDWQTASELENVGFYVERRMGGEKTWQDVGFVGGAGTSQEVQQYSWHDDLSGLIAKDVEYRLRQIDFDGTSSHSSIQSVRLINQETALLSAAPNPFGDQTKFSYSLAEEGLVKLSVYNLLGYEVARLVTERQEAGFYELNWDSTGLPAGIYSVRFYAGKKVQSTKVIKR